MPASTWNWRTSIASARARRSLDVEPGDGSTLEQRLAEWRRPAPRYTTGVFGKYARLVSSASTGAVTE
jgi:dihydroxy-acid dehydratase